MLIKAGDLLSRGEGLGPAAGRARGSWELGGGARLVGESEADHREKFTMVVAGRARAAGGPAAGRARSSSELGWTQKRRRS